MLRRLMGHVAAMVAAAVVFGTLTAASPASGQIAGFDAPEVAISAKASALQVSPGGQVAIAVVLDHGETLHSWPAADDVDLGPDFEFAILTEIGLGDVPSGVDAVGPVQWPEAKPARVANPAGGDPATVEALTYKGRAIAFIPVLISEDAAEGELVLPVSVTLQACDDSQCYMPQSETIDVSVVVAASPDAGRADADFGGFDASVFASLASGDGQGGEPDEALPAGDAAASAGPKFLGLVAVPQPGSAGFLPMLILLGFAGGFLLNLMPCVLPVIPLKVMTLTKHAGESRGRALVLGLWMFLGVTAFWSVLALPVVLVDSFADPSQIFGIWWITAGIGAVIFVMSLGLMGLFHVSLPQGAYMINPQADSPGGSFVFGVMTAVLGLPCFGVIVGALLPQATVAGSVASVAMFVSMGVGMGFPYLVLAGFPGLVSVVPKAGPASDLMKQVMSLLLMAAGAYFLGSGLIGLVLEKPYLGKVLHWWAVGLFVAGSGVWLLYRTLRITRKPAAVGVCGLIALLLTASGVWVASDFTDQERIRYEDKLAADEEARTNGGFTTAAWNKYSPELVEAALAEGRVVVMDFTAEWCLNCKALKRAVLNVDPVKPELMSDDVVAVTVDLTVRSAPGWQRLSDLGQTGIPTLAVFGPGLPDGPWISNGYTSEQVLGAIEAARGDSVAIAD
ncbi:MAG: thioredoxin family protein [Planctomycetota bacterium]